LSPKGVFYVIAIEENKPEDIMSELKRYGGFKGSIVLKRKRGGELLYLLKFCR
jgi:release factor glutamine methyltransferase